MGPAVWGLGMLLALPGALGSGGSARVETSPSSGTVILLLLVLLLLLLTGLALAWRRLSRDSGGYYHPARLGATLWGHTCRLLRASPPGRWLRARAQLDAGLQVEEADVGDGGWEAAADPEQDAEGASTQRVLEPADDSDQDHDQDGDIRGTLGLSVQCPAGAGGSSEALLSGLQAFAGSAAWDDGTEAAGSQGLHVTAL